MANRQDTYESVLKLVGAAQYIRYINQAAQGHRQLALAQQQQARAQAQVGRAMAGGRTVSATTQSLAGGAGIQSVQAAAAQNAATAVALAAITAVAAAVKSGIDAFADYDKAVLQTQVFLKNMGTNLPTAQFTEMARQLSISMGVSETEVVKLQGYLARFGTSGPEIGRATKIIVDAARMTNMGFVEMAQSIEMARRGNARALFRELGIPIRNAAGYLGDFDAILRVVERHTQGFSAAFLQTMPGAMERASSALERVKKEFGNLISPLVTTWLNQVANVFDMISGGINRLNTYLGITPGKLQGAVGTMGGGGNQSEEYLRRISENTGPQGALGRALRGGGSYGEAGGGLHIRTFNQMFRGVA